MSTTRDGFATSYFIRSTRLVPPAKSVTGRGKRLDRVCDGLSADVIEPVHSAASRLAARARTSSIASAMLV